MINRVFLKFGQILQGPFRDIIIFVFLIAPLLIVGQILFYQINASIKVSQVYVEKALSPLMLIFA
jgi:hypothetical protein